MAFKLNDIIIDRLLYGVAENFDGVVQYVLTSCRKVTFPLLLSLKRQEIETAFW